MKLLQMNHVKKSFNDETLHVLKAVSYTHLTLPTIRLV